MRHKVRAERSEGGARHKTPNLTYKGSTLTCRLRFSWKFQNFEIVVWNDTQPQNLQPKCIFSTLKNNIKKMNKKI